MRLRETAPKRCNQSWRSINPINHKSIVDQRRRERDAVATAEVEDGGAGRERTSPAANRSNANVRLPASPHELRGDRLVAIRMIVLGRGPNWNSHQP
jgi:hypothetical protein